VIGGCTQDPHIFNASIRENLRLARPAATDSELAEAARQARLLPWIQSLPRGWDTPAGTRGGAVSGGERQRLALARAPLAGPGLLILDEPTAHLDPETRAAVTAGLLEVTKGRATLLITHELRELDQVDEIVVLEAGKIAGRGTHQALLRECPLYQRCGTPSGSLPLPFYPSFGGMPGGHIAARVVNICVSAKSRMGHGARRRGMQAATR
jgi:ATP-binding cassette subfamily C protein CydC